MDIDNRLDHVGKDDAVSKVSFNSLGFFSDAAFLLDVDQFLKESSVSGMKLPSKSSSLSGSE